MSKVLVSADTIFPRMVELLNNNSLNDSSVNNNSVDLMRVVPPIPRVVRLNKFGLGSGSCLMWEIEREDFVIEAGDLPF
tara:strand:- start:314 stop:550 length:237 start_codon:yes stop_codon:yes gene_type:complete